jgi:GNAT superfamily N-acetyltransferase
MSQLSANASTAEQIQAMTENLWRYWTGYGTDVYEGSDYVSFFTGVPVPLFNAVFRARLEPDAINPTIATIKSQAQAKGVPLFWWVEPSADSHDLGEHLKAHGFIPSQTPAMALDLSSINTTVSRPEGFSLREIEPDAGDDLRMWGRIVGTAHGMPEVFLDPIHDVTVAQLHKRGNQSRRYLGYLNGEPVATAELFMNAGVAGVMSISTLAHAQRRGIGTLMTLQTLQDARVAGYELAVLQSTEQGFPVYQRMGFYTLCDLDLYLYLPQ